jgi:hypothetical protein
MTSFGQTLLRQYLARLLPVEMHENFRPPWLDGLELDFWYPTLNVAFEFQGGQHYVPRDGDRAGLHTQRANDRRKRQILESRGVLLIRIDAIHLWASALRGRIKAVANHHLRTVPLAAIRNSEFRPLDRQAREYRLALRSRFNCPTAHRRGAEPRRDATRAKFATAHG